MNHSPPSELPLDDLNQVDAVREQFESDWLNGSCPAIEEFLSHVDNRLRDALLHQLLQIEIKLRLKAGDSVQGATYLKRFATQVEVVRQVLGVYAPQLIDTDIGFNAGTDAAGEDAEGTGRPVMATAVVSVQFEELSEDMVGSSQPDTAADSSGGLPEVPVSIGRFQIKEVLGAGAFGKVFRAVDPDLQREVAIKLASSGRFSNAQSIQMFLDEARSAARVKHPGIVSVYDVGLYQQAPFVVMEYVAGGTLAKAIANERLTFQRSAELLAEIAMTLVAAHREGLVHRDLKPANILVDSQGQPHVADFGMALDEVALRGRRGEVAGTPAYMAPEQIRGETHMFDGRTDIWALGAILYELVTGQRPFRGSTTQEVFADIQVREPKPPRQLDPSIPAELERICLKCLSKRMTDRYTTAADLAADLRHWSDAVIAAPAAPASTGARTMVTPATNGTLDARESSAPIVPKGLRSFDAGDADFFLKLLPGPRDRTGLPDSLRFWKSRIEQTDAELTFRVGLIYGPSGCGKSSLVKAGLLPRLDQSITTVYIEATDDDTERRLLHRLSKQLTRVPEGADLAELLSAVRRGSALPAGGKLLLVIDQFEQWLHARRNDFRGDLLDALRQCDGSRVQAIVMVRDDFFISVSRFFQDLEIDQVQGHNFAVVDLFDQLHARKVLLEFGQAYGRLPDDDSGLSDIQRQFLDRAVEELSQDGKVISVRLALFAEMVKGKPWEPATLTTSGGFTGVGVTFLEETFSASTAPPRHRLYQHAARRALRVLLPVRGTDIKGHMRSADELRQAARCERDEDFLSLLQILDAEARLITPTDPTAALEDEGESDTVANHDPLARYYLLTHDYLVPALRAWLTRKQRESRRGRAELRLAERSGQWNAQPQNRHLPAWWEYLNIRLFTRRKDWTEPQQRMMRRAGQSHGLRWGTGLALALVVATGLQQWVSAVNHRNMVHNVAQAVANMGSARGVLVPVAIERLEDESFNRDIVLAELHKHYDDANAAERLRLTFALARFGEMNVEYLVDCIEGQPSGELPNIAAALGYSSDNAIEALRSRARASDADRAWSLKTKLALVLLYMGNQSIAAEMLRAFPVDPQSSAWDPIQRTTFVSDLSSYCDAPEQTVAAVAASDDPELRSGLCLALAEIDNPNKETRDAWQATLSQWAVESPDSGTHSGARLVLSRWGLEVPEIEKTPRPARDRDWWHTPKGHRMVRIRPGVVTDEHGERVAVNAEFWLSDVEVTVAQFEEFMANPAIASADCPTEKKPTYWEGVERFPGLSESDQQSHPVQNVSWYDAVKFCNWLSEQEGREPCYLISVDADDYVVTIHDSGTGYRLPTEAEWEYACRALTTTKYAYGESESQLVDYARFQNNCESQTGAVGSYLPNGWGLFDMHGNVFEWCWDVAPGGYYRVNRGGCWSISAEYCRSSNRNRNEPTARSTFFGFRLAIVPSSR